MIALATAISTWSLSPVEAQHRPASQTNSPSETVQLLLGNSKIESTARCLGIEVDDEIEMAEKIDIWHAWEECGASD